MNAMILELPARSPHAALALDVAVKATLVLAAAAVAALALRRSSAAARHLAWCLGLAAALAMPVLSLALPDWSWRVLPASGDGGQIAPTSTANSPAPRPARMIPATGLLDETASEEEALMNPAPAARRASRPTTASPIAPTSGPSWRIPAPSWSWLWAAWLAGALAVLTPPLAGRIALRRLTRDAEPIDDAAWTDLLRDLSAQLGLARGVTLLRSPRAAMPMTWGGIRPAVLLPAEADSWSLDRRRAVLLHELAHVQRFDCLTQLIARAACALYWFNPLAWLAARRMRIERERACDDVVLLAGARASEYADHLLEIARGLRAPRAALAALEMARPSQLEGRLVAILDPDRRRGGPGRKAAALAMLAAIAAVLPLAMLRVGARATAATAAGQGPIAGKPAADDPAARMTFTGRVLDPSGKPVPDAAVMVIVQSKLADRRTLHLLGIPMTDHHARCDGSGRFRVELPRTSSARHDRLVATAMAPGYGIGWTELDTDADPPTADIALRTEQVIQGRIFDVQGQPARGLALWVRSVHTIAHKEMTNPIFRPDFMDPPWHELPGWPGPAISDDDGRFTLRGMGPEVQLLLLTDDPRYSLPPTWISTCTSADARVLGGPFSMIKVEPGPDATPIKLTAQPARRIVGRVTHADTGQPVPHALVSVGLQRYAADGEGRFRAPFTPLTALVDRFSINARSPDAVPYLGVAKQGTWPKGAVEQSVDLSLPRGLVIHGKVTEEGTGRPIAGAVVWFLPAELPRDPSRGMPGFAVTGPDGTYRIAVPQGPCYLSAQGSDEFVLREVGGITGEFQKGRRRDRLYGHAARAIEVKPGGPDAFDLTLRRGVSVRGRVLDPDGRPVPDAWFYSRIVLTRAPTGGWQLWYVVDDRGRGHVRDGRFTLNGLDPAPGAEGAAYFLEPERKLGTTARFSAKTAADGDVTVRLERCGMAMARLVGPDGKPLERYPTGGLVSMVVTPGPPGSGRAAKDGPLFADAAGAAMLDPVNFGTGLESDAQGRVTFPALIPGASYRIVDGTPLFGGGEPVVRREFVVAAGEAVELGDVTIARPQRRNGR
jgi:beta-lactamase regulating signal transducer with metallopeptidase domain/protocatechuate 3,4-dioxygenase beta subunit